MTKFKDERKVIFASSLGTVLGTVMIHKADIPLIKEFGEKSKYTVVVIVKE
jgi:hypothetical protein